MSIGKKVSQVLLYGGIVVLFISSSAFSQLNAVGTAISGASYASWLNESAISTGGWHPIFKSNVSYNGNNPAEEIVQTTLGSLIGNWRNYEKYVYNYTGNKIQTVNYSYWDTTTTAWDDYNGFTFTWNGDLLTGFSFTGLLAGLFNAAVATTFVYDNADKMTSDSSLITITVGEVTMNIKSASVYTYGAGYEMSTKSEWDNTAGAYVVDGKDSTILCTDGLDSIQYNFSFDDQGWSEGEKKLYSYTTNRGIGVSLTQEYKSGQWLDENRTTYSYDATSVVQKIATVLQDAQQKAAQKLLSMNGEQHKTALKGYSFNALGQKSVHKSAVPTAANFIIVKK